MTATLTVACCLGTARESRAQGTAPGVVVGHVVDSAGRAVPEAEILAAPSDAPADAPGDVRVGRSRTDGRFVLMGLPSGRPHRLVVRHLGYRPDTTSDVVVRAGDTVRVAVVLRPAVAALPTVTVRERRTVSPYFRPFIDSTEITTATVARSYLRTGWDVVERLRPVMKGEWWKGCPALQHVFVNGQRMSSSTIISPQRVLTSIPAEDILEIRYLNCWDKSMPGVAGNNAAYVVLKPGRAYRP